MLDDDIWGQDYRLVTTRFRGLNTPYASTIRWSSTSVRSSFFLVCEGIWTTRKRVKTGEEKLFTMGEMRASVEKLKSGKALGLDGIIVNCVKKLMSAKKGWF